MIIYYKSITIQRNPEKKSKPSLYSLKISGIVVALSFSERPLLPGLDSKDTFTSSEKNTNYLTFYIFWFDVLICLIRFGSSLTFSLLPWKIINMTPPCGINYATPFFFLLSHWQRYTNNFSSVFQLCTDKMEQAMNTSCLTVPQLLFRSSLFPLLIFFVLSYTAHLYGQHWWLKKCRALFWSKPLGIVKVIISVLVGAHFSSSVFPYLLLFT